METSQPPSLSHVDCTDTATAGSAVRDASGEGAGDSCAVVPDFVEANVRTYVMGPDGRNGIWSFFMDCERLPVVVVLRALGPPHMKARAAVRREETGVVEEAGGRW